jgi:hypothetical protein
MDIEPTVEQSNTMPESHSGTAGGIDWEGLRELSLRPGGFREERLSLWCVPLNLRLKNILNVVGRPKLLKVDPPKEGKDVPIGSEEEAHQDENQIKLDTNRSFVMYPVGEHNVTRLVQRIGD